MRKDEILAKNLYNFGAYFYSIERNNKTNGKFSNGKSEISAMIKMLGNVRGKRILDWGCGSAIYARRLIKKGAKVKGFDISEEMIKIAKRENPKLDFRVGSGLKIPFDEKFDIVFASLSLHYLNDWDRAMKEIFRVLKRRGFFIFTLVNPVKRASSKFNKGGRKYRILGEKNYFKEGLIKTNWFLPNGKKLEVSQYHKTYSTIIKIILRNGFEIKDYEDIKSLDNHDIYSKIPNFCIWKVIKK